MTEHSVPLNPTIFMVTHKDDPRLSKDPYKYQIEQMILLHDESMYGSYYRPGEFWGEPIFVCPQCKHAMQEISAKTDNGFYCKHCYTDWALKDGQLYMQWTPFDESGKSLAPILI
jgi:hypothetical protein